MEKKIFLVTYLTQVHHKVQKVGEKMEHLLQITEIRRNWDDSTFSNFHHQLQINNVFNAECINNNLKKTLSIIWKQSDKLYVHVDVYNVNVVCIFCQEFYLCWATRGLLLGRIWPVDRQCNRPVLRDLSLLITDFSNLPQANIINQQ